MFMAGWSNTCPPMPPGVLSCGSARLRSARSVWQYFALVQNTIYSLIRFQIILTYFKLYIFLLFIVKICFPCALSVSWVRSNYFLISVFSLHGGFPTCPFIASLFKILEGFFITQFSLLKERDFTVNPTVLPYSRATPGGPGVGRDSVH